MKKRHHAFSAVLALAFVLAMAGCKPTTVVSNDKATSLMSGKSLTLRAKGQPTAKINEQGDLLIGGKAVDTTPEQRQLLLAYREEMSGIGQQGAEIGKRSAAIGASAAGKAVAGLLGNDKENARKNIEPEVEAIKQEALKLCVRLQALKQAQDTLATALPAFAPYASLEDDEVNDCRRDMDNFNDETASAGAPA